MRKYGVWLMVLCLLMSTCGCFRSETQSGIPNGDTAKAEELVDDDFVDPLYGWDAYDSLIAKAKVETDRAKRVEMLHDAEDMLMATGCVVPLYYYNDIYMSKPYVSGVYTNRFGYKFFHRATLQNGSKTLRVNLASEPDSLDPALNSSVDGACLAVASFAGLYTYNEQGQTVPDLAVGYTQKDGEDGSVIYTVTLKEGLKWSDGSALTAGDFVYAWKRAAATATGADYSYAFNGFKGYPNQLAVEAPDATTLTFTLTAPCVYLEGLLAFPTYFPVKQAAVESNPQWEQSPGGWCTEAGFVSNGPYVCTGWKHDVSMTYEKNPYYHDADRVTVDRLELMLSADDTAVYAAYNAGNLDVIDTVPTDEIASLLKQNNTELKTVDTLGTYYVAFNADSELFRDKTPQQAACMRLALSLIMDRNAICETVGQTGQVPASSYIPLGMADGNGGLFKEDREDNSYYDVDGLAEDYEETLEEARTYLRAAGYTFTQDGKLSSDTPLTIEYLTNDGTGHLAAAQIIQQDLAALGVRLTIRQMEWNTFLDERKKGNFDMARQGWLADFDDPMDMLEMFTTDSGNNDCQFGRPSDGGTKNEKTPGRSNPVI